MEADDNLLAAPVRRKDSASPRCGRHGHDVINRSINPLVRQGRRNERALEREIAIGRQMLERAAATDAKLAATCRRAVGISPYNTKHPGAIALNLRFDDFAGERERDKNLFTI